MPRATIPIYADDDFERMAELRMEVSIAERKYEAAQEEADEPRTALSRAGDDDDDSSVVAALKAEYEAAQQAFYDFVDEASERAENWVLKPIGHEAFRELLKNHPPRMVAEVELGESKQVIHADDAGWDVDTTTFPTALLSFVDPEDPEHRTIIEPEFASPEALRKRVSRLTAGELESMWTVAYMGNKGGIADPKLERF